MKLSNTQAIRLFDIAKDSLKYNEELGGFYLEKRKIFVEGILKQQSNKLKELK